MNNRDHYIKCLKAEVPIFVRVFKALPPDQLAYRPHPRSTSAGDLVWMLAGELKDAVALAGKHEAAFTVTPAPASLAEMIAAYEKNAAALRRRLAKVTPAAWAKKAKFLVEGKVAWEAPLGDMLWGFLFDAIHHRGQLSAYIRPMGGKVPSIYGPSADDPGH
ncbi:MAG TPA: DinB family protein [Thermoanaerobaculia bacterium]|nr:DinB family protein [Thermoanaerobaculia bacterium]HQR67595.1 DinB family protein [Thermoanaerobaculia bacterium]